MLSPKVQLNLRNAREYFREHLRAGDYYTENRVVRGQWFGQGAAKLGLKGEVEEAAFLALCEGRNPESGRRLTLRHNTVRLGDDQMVANRRVFYDFTISPPKSVSILALCAGPKIRSLHDQAVKMALGELERFARSRIRKHGQLADRESGNVVGAAFEHDTSRALDPHLHTHCIVFNATYDPIEGNWKALEAAGMYRAQKFVENYYYHELAKGLIALNYQIVNRPSGFEISGVEPELIERFSKRHDQIVAEAERQWAQGAKQTPLVELKERVARHRRQRKAPAHDPNVLRRKWRDELGAAGRHALDHLKLARPIRPVGGADEAIGWADELLFERRSVVREHELYSAALARGRGAEFSLENLRLATQQRGYIRRAGSDELTSAEVLQREWEIVTLVREGRGQYLSSFRAPDSDQGIQLSREQEKAALRLLSSTDFVTVFRGGAGTGKSATLGWVVAGIRASGRPVKVVAPQRQQVLDLERSGLAAHTLAQALASGNWPKGVIVLADEAGQIGGRDMHRLLHEVHQAGGRVILSGDTRQQGAVAASDALVAIERHGQLLPAEIRAIRRQDPRHGRDAPDRRAIRQYRKAVRQAAGGKIADSLATLEGLGWVQECSLEERRSLLASQYLEALDRKESALVVAQTWEEVNAVNAEIRRKLCASGRLGSESVITVQTVERWEEAQKRDPRFYAPEHCVCFMRAYGRFAKGEVVPVAAAGPRGLSLCKDGRRSTVSYRYADRLVVTRPTELAVAAGDRLQLKSNGASCEGRPFASGELVTFVGLRPDGGMVIRSDGGDLKTLAPHQRLVTRGYAVTAYASQGKTIDAVFIADAANAAATDRKQWYVAISRGRRRVSIFTSDWQSLKAAAQRDGERALALDLAPANEPALAWARAALAMSARLRQHESVVQNQVRSPARRRIEGVSHRP